jgi:hypothetical protein
VSGGTILVDEFEVSDVVESAFVSEGFAESTSLGGSGSGTAGALYHSSRLHFVEF